MEKINLSTKSRIFISSTFEDFEEFRQDLIILAQRMNQNFEGMEFFGAQSGEPIKTCLKKLETCHIYLGVIGARYGTLETKTKKSYTQLEYEHAAKLLGKHLLKDIWIYLPSQDCKFPVKFTENNPTKLKKLRKFIELTQESNVVEFYNNVDDLKLKIVLRFFNEITARTINFKTESYTEFDEFLDSSYQNVKIEGLEFLPSMVLKCMDEEYYKQCFLVWEESQENAKD